MQPLSLTCCKQVVIALGSLTASRLFRRWPVVSQPTTCHTLTRPPPNHALVALAVPSLPPPAPGPTVLFTHLLVSSLGSLTASRLLASGVSAADLSRPDTPLPPPSGGQMRMASKWYAADRSVDSVVGPAVHNWWTCERMHLSTCALKVSNAAYAPTRHSGTFTHNP